MFGRIGKLARAETGATAVEYGLILCMVVVVAIAGFGTLGGQSGGLWSDLSVAVVNAGQ